MSNFIPSDDDIKRAWHNEAIANADPANLSAFTRMKVKCATALQHIRQRSGPDVEIPDNFSHGPDCKCDTCNHRDL